MMSQVFYHCAIVEHKQLLKTFICHFLSPRASGRIQTLDLRMMSQVFYHHANGGPYNEKASVLPPCYWGGAQAVVKKTFICYFPSPLSSGRIQTLDLRTMRQVFYHCAIMGHNKLIKWWYLNP
jgi:hypothetical protein